MIATKGHKNTALEKYLTNCWRETNNINSF